MFSVDNANCQLREYDKDNFHESRQFYLVNQQSSPAHHLETVIWHSILHIAFICHFFPSVCDIILTIKHMNTSLHIHVSTCVNVPISMGHVTTQNKHYFHALAYMSANNILYY